ncbi:hypothetical protein [Bifidobacterium saguinibicoloris]|uniref:hypothetical protein n=1 Tax=Bifidobacterium saguinibicoloris TaxID=2834433 RepID=UPI001C5954F4|nr:hypothetical protein [Bifidobacterium saguinibicoloris]MBW3080672.1 hypothetical protein [Bifidobacterium saguinibicoloris]
MNPIVLHLTHQLADHSAGMTLCGRRIVTNRAVTTEVEAGMRGPWVTCPVCEAAQLLSTITPDDLDPHDPEPPKHRARRKWTQPGFPKSRNWK